MPVASVNGLKLVARCTSSTMPPVVPYRMTGSSVFCAQTAGVAAIAAVAAVPLIRVRRVTASLAITAPFVGEPCAAGGARPPYYSECDRSTPPTRFVGSVGRTHRILTPSPGDMHTQRRGLNPALVVAGQAGAYAGALPRGLCMPVRPEPRRGGESLSQPIADAIHADGREHNGQPRNPTARHARSRHGRPSFTIPPRLAVGGWIPRPRKPSGRLVVCAMLPHLAGSLREWPSPSPWQVGTALSPSRGHRERCPQPIGTALRRRSGGEPPRRPS